MQPSAQIAPAVVRRSERVLLMAHALGSIMSSPGTPGASRLEPEVLRKKVALEAKLYADAALEALDSEGVFALLALLEAPSAPVGEEPRCPECGYTSDDAQRHGDHHLCGGKIEEAPDEH